jgi:type III pantothenate kinase
VDESPVALLAIVVGNTNTRFASFDGREPENVDLAPNSNLDDLVARILRRDAALPSDRESIVVLASDNPPVSERLVTALTPKLTHDLHRVGDDLEVPIPRAIDPDTRPGQDRLLNALAAFDSLQQACAIIDVGTAVTVDFVDGQGVFQGGAIAPGATMMLRALHERTAALPTVALARPADSPFGKNTEQAMLNGVFYGIRGMVRLLVERYAEAYEAYPRVIATGSDAPLLFEDDPFIERIIPDLTLRGVEASCRRLVTD